MLISKFVVLAKASKENNFFILGEDGKFLVFFAKNKITPFPGAIVATNLIQQGNLFVANKSEIFEAFLPSSERQLNLVHEVLSFVSKFVALHDPNKKVFDVLVFFLQNYKKISSVVPLELLRVLTFVAIVDGIGFFRFSTEKNFVETVELFHQSCRLQREDLFFIWNKETKDLEKKIFAMEELVKGFEVAFLE